MSEREKFTLCEIVKNFPNLNLAAKKKYFNSQLITDYLYFPL